jgi:protein-disulfide isomerase
MVTRDTISMLTSAPRLVMPVSPRDHILGPIDARSVLVEYGDYECPFCRAAQPVVKAVKAAMGDEVALVFRHFPLSNIHPFAWKAAEAAEAAGAQGAFWEYHDTLFENQEALDVRSLVAYAQELGLDAHRFAEELASDLDAKRVHEDFRSGILSGVNGTPTFFVNGVRYDGGRDPKSMVLALRS